MHPLAALYPSLFASYRASLGEPAVIDALENADLDEDAARAFLEAAAASPAAPPPPSEGENLPPAPAPAPAPAAADPPAKLYCSCQQPDDGARMMVQCEGGCEEWFHTDCVGLSDAEAEALDAFVCEDCGGEARPARKPQATKRRRVGTAAAARAAAVRGTETPTLENNVMRDEAEILRDICRVEQELLAPLVQEEEVVDESQLWRPPPYCVPIRADVRTFDFSALAAAQKELTGGRLFDVILTDPPWQLATSNPTRGVAIGYDQLSDNLIRNIPFPSLQDNGFLFMWVINAKYRFALQLFEEWGYTLVDEITWVKRTVNRRLAKSHGFYLQHAKETCLVARKGADPPNTQRNVSSDVIFAERRGQSQKPTEIYELIEKLVPGGYYLEVFGRRNNTRDGFLTIGNEL